MKHKKILITMLWLCLFFPSVSLAEDNADGGTGNVGDAESGYAHYNSGEYMYKVSVYVGLSDQANTSDSNLTKFKMVGNAPIYIQPSHFTLPSSYLFYGNGSKIDYLNGLSFTATTSPKIKTPSLPPPAPPIVSGGSIQAIKEYFGDTETLNAIIDAFAEQKGTTREGLVSNIQFTINGVTGTVSPDRILPVKDTTGNYLNEVPWLVVYEPVIIAYLKDGTTKLAFTATEYALAQKLGYFNFGGGANGQMITAMTHRGLPNSIVLEHSWFGFPVTPPLAEGVNWANERIIQGGGWGMRFLPANASGLPETPEPEDPPSTFDAEYRVNTDVITSVEVYASKDVTPDELAYVHFTTSTGQSGTHELVIPEGGSQLAWFKWHTPNTPQNVTISISVSGNSSARIEGSSSATIRADVVELQESTPPHVKAFDINPEGFFGTPEWWEPEWPPSRSERLAASWGEWDAYWVPYWVYYPNWVWEGNIVTDPVTGESYDDGDWVDYGEWVDEGWWEYEWITYTASLNVSLNILPNQYCPTAKTHPWYYDKYQMPAGYGIDLDLKAESWYTGKSSMVTGAQNAIMYFPEFDYGTYNRVLELKKAGFNSEFWFKVNRNSRKCDYDDRVHYTPQWFPKELDEYRPQVVVFDMWTPAGMLSASKSNYIALKGAVRNDYHVGPMDPAEFGKNR